MSQKIIPVIRKGEFCDLPEPIPSWAIPILDFILQWTGPGETVELQTSGSTGTPKLMAVSKQAMRNSAQRTNAFFEIDGSEIALMPLSAKYIGGMMMLVRATEGNYDLDATEPSAMPFEDLSEEYSITSLVPMQLNAILEKDEFDLSRLKFTLIGGAPLSPKLEMKVQEKRLLNVYQGFGMTETVSHFALRRVGMDEPATYQSLEGAEFGVDDRECLWVKIPGITEESIQTNDVIRVIDNNHFQWLGRADWVINSGGIKIHPEQVEAQLSPFLKPRIVCAGLKDEKLGQALQLVIETEELSDAEQLEIWNIITEKVDKYHRPKALFCLKEFPQTASGKVNRRQISLLLQN